MLPILKRLHLPTLLLLTTTLNLIAGLATGADFIVTVQMIRVCDDDGSNCASPTVLKAADTNKIWDQAGVRVVYLLPARQLNSTAHNNLENGAAMDALVADPTNMANTDPSVVNLWYVAAMPSGSNAVTRESERAVALNAPILSPATNPSFPEGRIDVFAHELGHVFGLGHNDFGAGGPENLMTEGSSRTLPTTAGDLFPDGAQLDQLTASQITEVLTNNDILQPITPVPTLTPGGIGVAVLLMASIGILATRRPARSPAHE